MVKVKWQATAQEDLRMLCTYYRAQYAPRVAQALKEAFFTAALRLQSFPESGAKEELLPQDEVCFRYLVIRKHYKLIYFREADVCHIVAIWDCRNNPEVLQRKKLI